MHRLLLVSFVAVALMGGPVHAEDGERSIHQYAFWDVHREDAGDLSGWKAVYTFTHATCESAVQTALGMAYRDGWEVETIDPPFDAVVRAFPVVSPCSATLALR